MVYKLGGYRRERCGRRWRERLTDEGQSFRDLPILAEQHRGPVAGGRAERVAQRPIGRPIS